MAVVWWRSDAPAALWSVAGYVGWLLARPVDEPGRDGSDERGRNRAKASDYFDCRDRAEEPVDAFCGFTWPNLESPVVA
jgi:hypothetical protein